MTSSRSPDGRQGTGVPRSQQAYGRQRSQAPGRQQFQRSTKCTTGVAFGVTRPRTLAAPERPVRARPGCQADHGTANNWAVRVRLPCGVSLVVTAHGLLNRYSARPYETRRVIAGRGQDGHVEVQGFADGRFDLVRECFAGILAAQPGTGAAFAAWCDGRLVVDLWGGSPTPDGAAGGKRAAWSSHIRSASRSRRCVRCGWSRLGGSSWTRRYSGTGPVSAPRRRCVRCCRIRPGW